MKINKLLIAAVLAIAIGAPIAGFVGDIERAAADDIHRSTGSVPSRISRRTRLPVKPNLASLERADEWLNSPPLTRGGSARQSRPHRFLDLHLHQLAAHASLCPRLGREIQGPRIGGDRRPLAGVRVRERTQQRSPGREGLRIDYPVAVDNDHVIWRAFRNQYWPALYFIDAQGRVRHHHFGEGAYEQSEMIIQAIAGREREPAASSRELVSVDAPRSRSGRRLGQPEVSGKLCRV